MGLLFMLSQILNIFFRLFFENGLAQRTAEIINYVIVLYFNISFIWISSFPANWTAVHIASRVVKLLDLYLSLLSAEDSTSALW